MSTDELTWSEANETCASIYGGQLGSIHSEDENRADNVWIGGIRSDGNFEWIDETPFNYTNWAPGQPDGDGDCVEIWSPVGAGSNGGKMLFVFQFVN